MNNIDFLSRTDIQLFIENNLNKDVKTLALQKHPYSSEEWLSILQQIQSKQKSHQKLPTWYSAKGIIFPSSVSVEQTSSEILAQYKSNQMEGKTLIDITGGFGIDAYYFSKKFDRVLHCEINQDLSAIVAHNATVLKADNITCQTGDGLEILKSSKESYDIIYIDPARRDAQQKKVFALQDCLPNIPEHLDTYLAYANNLVIKTAPLLDFTAGLQELKNVKKIEVVSLHNEVKELLWFLEKDYTENVEIKATNIDKDGTIFSYSSSLIDDTHYTTSQPLVFLYEPYNCLLKTGTFNAIGNQFQLHKLALHSHLYTSQELIEFPGRRFRIKEVIPFHKLTIKERLQGQKAHISTRNFPLKVEEIRKKYKILDGGDVYAFFTSNAQQEKIVILTEKIA